MHKLRLVKYFFINIYCMTFKCLRYCFMTNLILWLCCAFLRVVILLTITVCWSNYINTIPTIFPQKSVINNIPIFIFTLHIQTLFVMSLNQSFKLSLLYCIVIVWILRNYWFHVLNIQLWILFLFFEFCHYFFC